MLYAKRVDATLEPISSLIKKLNFYDISSDEMKNALENFKRINVEGFKPGNAILVPVLERHLRHYC